MQNVTVPQGVAATASVQSGEGRPGVTLVELLVFLAVFSIVAFAVLPLLFSANESRVRQQTMSLVEQNGAQVLQGIGYRLKDAERILDPPQGKEGVILTLQTGSGVTNPTIIGMTASGVTNIWRLTRQIVTSSEVTIRDFQIRNTSVSDAQQSFRVSFRAERTMPFSNHRIYSRTFEGVFTLPLMEQPSGAECGGVTCAAPSCSGNTYSWEVCQAGACQAASLPMQCAGFCCTAGPPISCTATTLPACTSAGGTLYPSEAACDTACQSGSSSSAASCGACPAGEACNPSGFCQQICASDADCGAPSACFVSGWRLRMFPRCTDGFCTEATALSGCGGADCDGNPSACSPGRTCVTEGTSGNPVSYCACIDDADCSAGEHCILDELGNRFCTGAVSSAGSGGSSASSGGSAQSSSAASGGSSASSAGSGGSSAGLDCQNPVAGCLMEASDDRGPLGPFIYAPGNQVTLTMHCFTNTGAILPIERAVFYQSNAQSGLWLVGDATAYAGGLAMYKYVTRSVPDGTQFTGVGQFYYAGVSHGGCGNGGLTMAFDGPHWCEGRSGQVRYGSADLGYPQVGTWPQQGINSDCGIECANSTDFCLENPGAGYTGCGGGGGANGCRVSGTPMSCPVCP